MKADDQRLSPAKHLEQKSVCRAESRRWTMPGMLAEIVHPLDSRERELRGGSCIISGRDVPNRRNISDRPETFVGLYTGFILDDHCHILDILRDTHEFDLRGYVAAGKRTRRSQAVFS